MRTFTHSKLEGQNVNPGSEPSSNQFRISLEDIL